MYYIGFLYNFIKILHLEPPRIWTPVGFTKPVPIETHTCGRGCGFRWVLVDAGKPQVCQYGLLVMTQMSSIVTT